jgi:biopolymer transport protein TolR
MPLKRARLRISDYNDKRKKRLKNQERRIRMVSLSLTSMVDMFAILVIFLLVNSSTVTQWIEVSQGIELPKAGKTDQPVKAATISISMEGVFADNQLLIKSKDVLQTSGMIGPVKAWLAKTAKLDGYVNLVAHEKVPFGIIKRVIGTCQDAGFGKVNLAVQPRD